MRRRKLDTFNVTAWRWLMLPAAATSLVCSDPPSVDTLDASADVGPHYVADADRELEDDSIEGTVARVDVEPADTGRDGPTDDVADDPTDADGCGAIGPDAVYVPDADDDRACSTSTPCPAGLLCVGDSCDSRWECLSHGETRLRHPCPTEVVAYCGCDGATFLAINSCPDRPYQHIGACDDGVNCDPSDLRCSQEEPRCDEGSIASVVYGSYGACVPFSSCRCEFLWECPHRDKYVCDRMTQRCRTLTP